MRARQDKNCRSAGTAQPSAVQNADATECNAAQGIGADRVAPAQRSAANVAQRSQVGTQAVTRALDVLGACGAAVVAVLAVCLTPPALWGDDA